MSVSNHAGAGAQGEDGAVSRALAGRMLLMVALVDHHLRVADLEHRGRFVPSGDDKTDDRIDIVEVDGGVTVSIQLAGGRYGVNRYHRDDEERSGPLRTAGFMRGPARRRRG